MSQIHAISQGHDDVVTIKSVQYGVLSPEAILSQSCAHIYKHMTKGGEPAGTLSDPRLGATQNTRNAITYASAKTDHGNFGHCQLSLPVYHPLYYKQVYDIMKTICLSCASIRITADYTHANLKALTANVNPMERLDILTAKVIGRTKGALCPYCSAPYPDIVNDNQNQVLGMAVVYKKKIKAGEEKKKDIPQPISSNIVHEILKRITDEDSEIMR
jgi:DNA-directed RNA polymerase beta' subunit